MDKLNISNFGPINEANVAFGDLTFIVGPQATGKSLFLELFKLIVDKSNIVSTLKNNYIILDRTTLLNCYFGKGLSSLFSSNTKVVFNNKFFDIDSLLYLNRSVKEKIYYIPAQRIMSLNDGSPKGFIDFNLSTPYVLRSFSESLRQFIQGMDDFNILSGIERYKSLGIKNNVRNTIFHDADLLLELNQLKRELKLQVGNMRIPFMAWSAGQKEFMPLFLAFYSLIAPSNLVKRPDYKWVIVEEPEMGLHPKAIESVLLEIIDLMNKGYKVVVSTHSSTFLDFAWTFNCIKKNDEDTVKKALCELFGFENNAVELFDGIKKKSIKTYYSGKSNANGVEFTDISSLDACDDNLDISEWGGLSSFAGRASDVVSKYIMD